VTVVRGQEAKLKWVFQTSNKITFHGIVWTIKDRLFKNSTKLLWMDRDERLYRHLHTKNRPDYDVKLKSETINNTDVQLTIVIPNVQRIHENKYICHVMGFKIGPFEIELKVKGEKRIILLVTIIKISAKIRVSYFDFTIRQQIFHE
jgi:hypothetical protein